MRLIMDSIIIKRLSQTDYYPETEKIKFGNSTLEILFVPGHAPGHIAFFDKSRKNG